MIDSSSRTQLEAEVSQLRSRLAWYKKRDELLLQLSGRVRASSNVDAVLRTTAVELTNLLHAQRCQIEIELDDGAPPKQVAYPEQDELSQGQPSRAIASPIMHQHELLGTVTVFVDQSRDSQSAEKALLQAVAGELAMFFVSIRLRKAQQFKSWEASQLRSVIRLIANERDPHTLSQRLTELTIQLLQADQGWVGYRYSDAIVVTQFYKKGRWLPVNWSFAKGEGAAGEALSLKRPYLSHHCGRDPNIAPDYIKMFGCDTLLALPIVSSENVYGVIEIHNKSGARLFSQEDVRSATMIAYQSAIAIERRELFAEMTHRASALETLLKVNARLNEQLNPTALIQSLIKHSANLVDALGGMGGLLDGQQLNLNRYWFYGAWHELELEGYRLAMEVIQHQRPIVVDDYPHDPRASHSLASLYKIYNALSVPIVNVTGEAIGFLEVHNKQGNEAFTPTDIEVMETLANTAAVAIGNSLLFDELDKQRSQLRALSAQLVTVLEDERRRIAGELHDEAGQLLIGIKLNLRVLAKQLPAALQQEVEQIRVQVNEANERLQALARGLRPPTLDELGLKAALERLVGEFEKSSGLEVQFKTAVSFPRLNQQIEIACYRIVQEALTNIVRHTNATAVQITIIGEESELVLQIADNGQGVDPEQKESGLGLLGMRERAAMLNGRFALTTKPGRGTQIRVSIPITEGRKDSE